MFGLSWLQHVVSGMSRKLSNTVCTWGKLVSVMLIHAVVAVQCDKMFQIWMVLALFLPTPTALTERKVEQRSVLKFLTKTGAMPIDCWHQMKQVFGQSCMSQTRVCVWHKCFKQGRESPKDNQHSGRKPTTSSRGNVEHVRRCLEDDRRKTVRMMATELDLPKTGVHRILKGQLKLSKISLKLIPRMLTDEQQAFRKRLCEENLELLRTDDSLFSRVVTGDETWVCIHEVQTKQMSSEWIPKGQPAMRPMKPRCDRFARKQMLTVFYDERGPVLIDFLPPGESVTADQYLEVLQRLKERIRRKRPELWAKDPTAADPQQRKFIIHHDNATPHTASNTLAFFLNIPMLPHPPYSPDIAPCDFFLFPRMKSELAAMQIGILEELRVSVKAVLKSIPQEHYRASIQQLALRWMKCVAADGAYFEGRHYSVDPDDFGLTLEYDHSEGSSENEDSSEEESDAD